jgi:hypothetical protein
MHVDLSSYDPFFLAFLFHVGTAQTCGRVKKREEVITTTHIDDVHSIEDLLLAEWNKMTFPKIKHRIAEMGVWIVGGFLCQAERQGDVEN